VPALDSGESVRYMLTISLALILPVSGGFTLVPDLANSRFPPAGRDQFYIDFELSNQTALEQTQTQVLPGREDSILNHPDVVDICWFMGESASVCYNVGRRNARQAAARASSVQMSATHSRGLQSRSNQAFPDAMVIIATTGAGTAVLAAPRLVHLYGSDLEQLQHFR